MAINSAGGGNGHASVHGLVAEVMTVSTRLLDADAVSDLGNVGPATPDLTARAWGRYR